MSRPSPFAIGHVRVRAIRGPHRTRAATWYWRAELYAGGASRTVWTGWATEDEATREVAALVADGGDAEPDADEVAFDDVETVKDVLELWLGHVKGRVDLSERTQDIYERVATGYLAKSLLRHTRIVALDVRTLEVWRSQALRLRSPRTVALELRILKIAWNWAFAIGLVPRELPPVKVRIPVEVKRTPTAGEVAAVIRHLTGWRAQAVELLWATGARAGEIAALRWEDVEAPRTGICWVTLTGKRKQRRVPIAADLLGPRGTGRVLPVGHKTVTQTLGPRYITPACLELGIEPFTPHGLRRAAADRMLRSGVDVGAAAAFLGQKPETLLRHYRQASARDLEHAADVLRALPRGDVIDFPADGDPHK